MQHEDLSHANVRFPYMSIFFCTHTHTQHNTTHTPRAHVTRCTFYMTLFCCFVLSQPKSTETTHLCGEHPHLLGSELQRCEAVANMDFVPGAAKDGAQCGSRGRLLVCLFVENCVVFNSPFLRKYAQLVRAIEPYK